MKYRLGSIITREISGICEDRSGKAAADCRMIKGVPLRRESRTPFIIGKFLSGFLPPVLGFGGWFGFLIQYQNVANMLCPVLVDAEDT